MFVLLAAPILRPVGFGYRNHLTNTRWRGLWDQALMLAGVVPALLFGVAFGNLFLGLPFSFDALQRPTSTAGLFSILPPFALLAGFMSLPMRILHGAAYAAMKVGEPMGTRANRLGRIAAVIFLLTFISAGFWLRSGIDGYRIVGSVDHSGASNPLHKMVELAPGAWLDNFYVWHWMWAAPLGASLAALCAHAFLHLRRPLAAFLASALVQAGTILTAGYALFPFLLPSSSNPNHSLTVWDASSSSKTLFVMFCTVAIFLPIVLIYTGWVFRVVKGRVTLDTLREHESLH